MKSESQLKVQKCGNYKYLVIYYKLNNTMIRINTKQYYIEGKHQKDLYYNNKMDNYLDINESIRSQKFKIDSYIRHQIKTLNFWVDQKEVEKYLKEGFIQPQPKETILQHYQDFWKYKETELGNSPSMKDYKSLENALIDFQTYKKQVFKLENITPEFILEFRNYLAIAHTTKDAKSKGNLNNNTILKRISSLRSFCRWLEEEEKASFKEKIYKIKTVKQYNPDSVALNKKEIQQLIDLVPCDKKEEKIIDLFVLNCYMGLRFGDLMTLDKGTFSIEHPSNNNNNRGGWIYTKINEKTDTTISLPVLPTALKILQKYNFQIPRYCQQYFNSQLKKILSDHELFGKSIKKSKRQIGKIEPTIFLKRDMISSHTCRRSFITLAISYNVPLNAIMAATGHTQLRTLQKYIKKTQNRRAFEAIDL